MKPDRPNILLFTADDMNWDAVGAFGCAIAGTTPHIDRLAATGIRFDRAHVAISVCQPSRSALMTGRYPHRCGGEGFFHLRHPGLHTLPELLRDAGYQVGILGKVAHSTPYADFSWDCSYDRSELGQGRNPQLYGRHASAFIGEARAAGRPFFLMANSHDPHRPFFGNDVPEWYSASDQPRAAQPSRVFRADEMTVPGFLPDLPEVRQELAEYCSSVRRCDDAVGAVLAALAEHGAAENTIVVFLSDNGMAFPFAKANCYLHSTRTPWLMRWPGRIAGGLVERDQFISAVDLLPTLLEALGLPVPDGIDGRSFLPLLRGEPQAGREFVFTQFHQTSGKRNYPMRCVQSRRYGYIFNPWSDGERRYRNESQQGRSFAAMRNAAEADPDLRARVALFEHRVPEELYDFTDDPDALRNLIGEAAVAAELERLRTALEAHMLRTGDPALHAFRQRRDRVAVDAFMAEVAAQIGGE